MTRGHVLYLNNFAHPYLGGGEVHLMHLIRATLAAGLDVSLAAPPGSAIARDADLLGATVFETDFSAARVVQTVHELRDIAYRQRPTIVHGTGYFTNVLARSVGELVVNTVHTMPDAPLAENPGLKSHLSVRARAVIDGLTGGRDVRTVADSAAIGAALRRGGVRVIHNGVDPDALCAEAESGDMPPAVRDARERGAVIVGCVSRLERVKGVVDLVQAAERIVKEVPDAAVFIAGTGSLESELREHIAARSGLAQHVALLGYVESAAAFIGGLDVFVLPSHSEGFNTTILEAMALRVPVVATDVGGAGEAIENGVSGVLVPSRQPEALADAVIGVLGDHEHAAAMAVTAEVRLRARFTVEHMTREYLALYDELFREAGRA